MINYSPFNIPCEFGSFSLVKSDPLITEVFFNPIDRVNTCKKAYSSEGTLTKHVLNDSIFGIGKQIRSQI